MSNAQIFYGSVALFLTFCIGALVGAAWSAPYLPDDMAEPTHPPIDIGGDSHE